VVPLRIKDTQPKAKHETILHYGQQECDDLNDHHNNLAVCSYKSIRQKVWLAVYDYFTSHPVWKYT
jgi:hypothetical protein